MILYYKFEEYGLEKEEPEVTKSCGHASPIIEKKKKEEERVVGITISAPR